MITTWLLTVRVWLMAALLMGGVLAPATVAAQATPEAVSADTTILLGERVEVQGDGVEVSGSNVTITAGGTYALTGGVADSMVTVQAPGDDVTLVLNGVDIANSSGPAVYIAEAGAATVTLAAGTENFLADGGTSEQDAALYSAAPLVINGEGSLEVEGNNNEGVSSTTDITIESGDIHVRAVEDGFNANYDGVSQINFYGGSVFVETEAGDAIDSNGTVTVTGGTVVALGALVDMNGGIDSDGAVTFDGGVVISTGSRESTPVSTSKQKSLLLSFRSTQAAGTLVVITDSQGTPVLTFEPAADFQQLLVSLPDLVADETYTVYVGGTATGAAENGVYVEAPTDLGTEVGTVTTDSVNQQRPGPP